jgi:hypothetical protein
MLTLKFHPNVALPALISKLISIICSKTPSQLPSSAHNKVRILEHYIFTSKALSIYGSTALWWILAVFSASWVFTQSVGPIYGGSARRKAVAWTQDSATQNKRTQTSIIPVGFELTTPVFERAKTVHALDRTATVINLLKLYPLLNVPLPEGRAGAAWKPSKPRGGSSSCSSPKNVVSLTTPLLPSLLSLFSLFFVSKIIKALEKIIAAYNKLTYQTGTCLKMLRKNTKASVRTTSQRLEPSTSRK